MEGTIAEIRLFAGNFSPRSWAFCIGQLLSISEYDALFALLGTTYGGDGQNTFALPDLRGRVPVGTGQGPGLPSVELGEMAGNSTKNLLVSNMPAHTHAMTASADGPTLNTASGNSLASQSRANGGTMPNVYAAGATSPVAMASQTSSSGGNQPFSIMQPYLGLNYIICLEGIFPSRN